MLGAALFDNSAPAVYKDPFHTPSVLGAALFDNSAPAVYEDPVP